MVDDRVHERARSGFQSGVEAYERGRPEYPAAAVSLVAEHAGAGARVLDVGAGTGKLTKLLLACGVDVSALEPVSAMREKLRAAIGGERLVDGTAEAIAAPDASFDAIVCAQAFHWFAGARALAEFRRVLEGGGRLALVWNTRVETDDWVRRLGEIIDRHAAHTPRAKSGAWRGAFDGAPFSPPTEASFPFVHEGPPELVVDRVASISFIAALPPEARAHVLAEVRELLRDHPTTAGHDVVAIPYRTDVFLYRALPRDA